jgi:Heavy metal binding domain
MFGNDRRWPAAAMAGGLIALAALVGCKGEPSVASRSAAAFREAQKKGETFEGAAHGHGAMTPGGGQEMPGTAPESGGAAGHSGMAMEGMDHSGMAMGGKDQSGKAEGMDHSKMGRGGMDHSGMTMGGKDQSGQAEGMDHSKMGQGGMDHSGMTMGGMDPAEPAPIAASPGQPAATLRPDSLDAPAATSVTDAQRSAEMAEEMTGMGGMDMGGHSGHGSGTYRQIDAGLGPGAHQGSEPQTPGAGPHQHGGPATPAPSGQEGDHSQHEPPGGGRTGGAAETAAVYACPMHPEVTSTAPGKCPKCGMTLVKRRKG